MYENIYDEMIDTGVAVKLESLIYQDHYGKLCTEEDSCVAR